MVKKQRGSKNLKLAIVFITFVLGLIAVSTVFKFIFLIKDSKFDGTHRFIVAFVGKNNNISVVSFYPESKSIYILKIDSRINENNLQNYLDIPIDGFIRSSIKNISTDNLSNILFKSTLDIGNSLKNITVIDALRLFLFSKSVPSGSYYQKDLASNLNDAQKSTILTLTFTDPQIYQDNLSIQIVNATNVYGLGSRLANFITNIGGNVVLVSTADSQSSTSKIIFYQTPSYTVRVLSRYLGFPLEKSNTRGVSDVIIIVGTDKLSNLNF